MSEPPDREVDLFNAALELSASRRQAYLKEACGGDTQLYFQIQALLQAHEKAGASSENGSASIFAPARSADFHAGRNNCRAREPIREMW